MTEGSAKTPMKPVIFFTNGALMAFLSGAHLGSGSLLGLAFLPLVPLMFALGFQRIRQIALDDALRKARGE